MATNIVRFSNMEDRFSRSLWTPSNISTEAWYDASDSSTITEVGGAVSQLDDKSGNANHVTQTDGAKQPITGTRTLNGLNVLDCDGVDDVLFKLNGNPTSSPDVVLVGVFDIDSDQINRDGMFRIQDRMGLDIDRLYVGVGKGVGFSDTGLAYGSTYLGANLHYGVAKWDASASLPLSYCRAYVNGTQEGSDVAYNNVNDGLGSLNVMSENNPVLTIEGAFAEAIVLTDTSEATRQKIEGYLAWKWGLYQNLPSGHPYEKMPPVRGA